MINFTASIGLKRTIFSLVDVEVTWISRRTVERPLQRVNLSGQAAES